MKVKVIDVTGARNLAIGKVYDVVEQKANGNYVIKNEVGVDVSFKASRFEVVREVPITFTFELDVNVANKLNTFLDREHLTLKGWISNLMS